MGFYDFSPTGDSILAVKHGPQYRKLVQLYDFYQGNDSTYKVITNGHHPGSYFLTVNSNFEIINETEIPYHIWLNITRVKLNSQQHVICGNNAFDLENKNPDRQFCFVKLNQDDEELEANFPGNSDSMNHVAKIRCLD